mgnify:CR=1 FL=1
MKKKQTEYDFKWLTENVTVTSGKETIGECLKAFSERYEIDYEEHKVRMFCMLKTKLGVTKEDITDHDCKEVCKSIAEGLMLGQIKNEKETN